MADMESCSSSSTLEFFTMVGKLKHLKRTGWVNHEIAECESVAGHMYRMSIMAFLLNDDALPKLNRDKCIKMALVHDMAECIVGDLTPSCGISKEEKHKQETEAMKHMGTFIGKTNAQEFLELYQEYEAQQTAEAKAVKDLDKLDMILQAYEYEKATHKPNFLQGFFNYTEGTFKNAQIMNWVQELKKQRSDAFLKLSQEKA